MTTITSQADVQPICVRVAGVLSATPVLPAGGAFMIMPLSALRGAGTPPVVSVNEMLLTGTCIDSARLAAVMNTMVVPFVGATLGFVAISAAHRDGRHAVSFHSTEQNRGESDGRRLQDH